MHQYDSIVTGSIDLAQSKAIQLKNTELSKWHLLYGLINNPKSFTHKKLKTLNKIVKEKLLTLPTSSNPVHSTEIKTSSDLADWITLASSHAVENSQSEIKEKNLLRYLTRFFAELNIDPNELSESNDEGSDNDCPDYLINLNEMAMEGKLDPVIGRTKEIRAVMEILGRRSKNNPVLVGPAGVGKTAIIEGLAESIVKGNVSDVLKDKTIYSLNLGALMAGTKYRGEFEERLQNLMKFIKSIGPNAILFIDEVHQLVGAGKTDGAMDAANLLKPALARGELHCIGATTQTEYEKYILGDSALDRRFRPVKVLAPSIEDSVEILLGLKEKFEIHHGIKISKDAIYSSVLLSDQYINDKNLPDKAIDLIDEAASALKISAQSMPPELIDLESQLRSKKIYAQLKKDDDKIKEEIVKLENEFNEKQDKWKERSLQINKISGLKNQLDKLKFDLEEAQRKADYEKASQLKYSLIPELETQIKAFDHDWILSKKHIADVISRQTQIPIEKILQSKQDHILGLEEYLKSEVYGQDQALHEIADALVCSHAGLTEDYRPLGSFLLLGPSGVGKTQTAKAVSKFLYNTEKKIIRFDMSEYSQKHDVAKLIGAPAGYVGYEEGGSLTSAIRNNPYALILFDEIEKAHYDLGDILLQILDDGRLTDNKGRVVSFRNTIIIMTSNSKNIYENFRPEVLGRIDAILTYNSLDKNVVDRIINKQLLLLNQRLIDKEIEFFLGGNLLQALEKRGIDPKFGARALNSVFKKLVTRPISQEIIRDNLRPGKYIIDIQGEETKIMKK